MWVVSNEAYEQRMAYPGINRPPHSGLLRRIARYILIIVKWRAGDEKPAGLSHHAANGTAQNGDVSPTWRVRFWVGAQFSKSLLRQISRISGYGIATPALAVLAVYKSESQRRFDLPLSRPARPSGAGAALSTIMASDPVFFELSWSILSTIGAANVFFGLLVISVTNFSPIAVVPLITSTACAVANGLCYYAFYLTYPPAVNRAVASAFADMLWLVSRPPPGWSNILSSPFIEDRINLLSND